MKVDIGDLVGAALQRPRVLVALTVKNLEKAELWGAGPVFETLDARGLTLAEALAEARGEA